MEIAAVLKPHFPLLTYPKFRAPKFMMYLVGPFVGAFVVACMQLQHGLINLSSCFSSVGFVCQPSLFCWSDVGINWTFVKHNIGIPLHLDCSKITNELDFVFSDVDQGNEAYASRDTLV